MSYEWSKEALGIGSSKQNERKMVWCKEKNRGNSYVIRSQSDAFYFKSIAHDFCTLEIITFSLTIYFES